MSLKEDRVAVVIDGENLRRGSDRFFGGPIHPFLLVREVAQDRHVSAVRYVTGRYQRLTGAQHRRLQFIAHTGVELTTVHNQQRWRWRLPSGLPGAQTRQGEDLDVTIRSEQRFEEKGVDVTVALHAVQCASRSDVDAVVLVSADADLRPVAPAIHALSDGRVGVETVTFVKKKRFRAVSGFSFTHPIDSQVFGRCADEFDYSVKLRHQGVDAFCAIHGLDPWPAD